MKRFPLTVRESTEPTRDAARAEVRRNRARLLVAAPSAYGLLAGVCSVTLVPLVPHMSVDLGAYLAGMVVALPLVAVLGVLGNGAWALVEWVNNP